MWNTKHVRGPYKALLTSFSPISDHFGGGGVAPTATATNSMNGKYQMKLVEYDEKNFILSIHPSTHLSIYLSVYTSIYLSIYLSVYTSIDLSIDLSIYLSIYLSIDRSIHSSIDKSKYIN